MIVRNKPGILNKKYLKPRILNNFNILSRKNSISPKILSSTSGQEKRESFQTVFGQMHYKKTDNIVGIFLPLSTYARYVHSKSA